MMRHLWRALLFKMKSLPRPTYDDGMEFLRRVQPAARSAALFPGAWNPPTVAHLAIARRALEHADEVIFTIPNEFPHKPWQGAPRETRLDWLCALAADEPRFSVALTSGGLFLDMARELRDAGHTGDVYVVCGGDAAERAVEWDYGPDAPIESQLGEYAMLVAPRPALYMPPTHLRGQIVTLSLPEDLAAVSSTAVRHAIDAGEDWTRLVPACLRDAVRDCYGGRT